DCISRPDVPIIRICSALTSICILRTKMAITTAIRSTFTWSRGPASHEDGVIVMRVDDDPIASTVTLRVTDAVDVKLSRIHTPDDAVAFVGRFGLLTRGHYDLE